MEYIPNAPSARAEYHHLRLIKTCTMCASIETKKTTVKTMPAPLHNDIGVSLASLGAYSEPRNTSRECTPSRIPPRSTTASGEGTLSLRKHTGLDHNRRLGLLRWDHRERIHCHAVHYSGWQQAWKIVQTEPFGTMGTAAKRRR